jgi:thioredoxin reductase (NADPH)
MPTTGKTRPASSTNSSSDPAVAGPANDTPIETDALVIGAGPVGLFQVFQLGLLGVKAHIIDSLPQPGGQCVELYADKPIYDIPAVPVCTGHELTERLLQQIAPFRATFHLGQEVTHVEHHSDDAFAVETSNGTRLRAKTIFIAGGVGSFQPRRLKVDGLHKHVDAQVFYRVEDPVQFADKHIVVVGEDDSALAWALHFAHGGPQRAASVTLLHRRDAFKAAPATVAAVRALCEAQQMQFIVGQVTGIDEAEGRLRAITVTQSDGATRRMPLDALLVLLGLAPKLGPIAGWGLALERKQLVVDAATFETSTQRIFAVGDVNSYAGKKKLIVCGFHEATLAAYAAAAYLFPDAPVQLQYTTTSPQLHRRLGVQTPVLD